MSDTRELCGLFGKLPQQADFVSRHLSEEFTGYWHTWLQSALSVSREQLGDDWLSIYLTSPIWRFAIAPGVCSAKGVVGVMVPSVDEVGRYFPLVIAHIGAHRAWTAFLSDDPWYSTAEQVALSALAEDMGYARLLDDVEALPEPEFRPLPQYRTIAPLTGSSRACAVAKQEQDTPADLVLALTEKAYGRLLGPHSLWWTKGSECVEPCFLISAGLPEAGQLAAMFDGEWSRWGWAAEQVVQPDERAVEIE